MRLDLIEQDFFEHFGLDLAEGIMRRRSGRWFRARIIALLTMEPVPRPHPDGGQIYVHRSRLGRHLFPND